MENFPATVKVVEVGPRDGLQNETQFLPTDAKIDFINRLSETGLSVIEVTSFVRPDRVPQLADAEAVCTGIARRRGTDYPVLVPNMQGLERALKSGATSVAVFAAVSETFSRKNVGCTIEESLEHIKPVIARARELHLRARAYLSCCLGCPYEGHIRPASVADLAGWLLELGCDEISLGDTIGAGNPGAAREMVAHVSEFIPADRLALHFHDTRGQALANILACLDLGVATIDASVAGLGGCPYAPGAGGNVATEDVVYMLHGMGIKTGVDLAKLIEIGRCISTKLARQNESRVGRAGVPEWN
ncbi:MAG: hydroxymethylglutaryl-CoA lyase [Chromatiales bacterium]